VIMYEYRCKTCRHVFTVRRKMGEAKEREACPDCAGEGVRLFARPHLSKFIAANPNDREQWR
jgi:putative FmdB family regulatory protein